MKTWMKKGIALTVALLMVLTAGAACAEGPLSYEGTVTAGAETPVAAPFGGRIGQVSVISGSRVKAGDPLATILTTLHYAPVEGTITGLYAEEGDSTETITERYGAVLYIEPTRKYMLEATSDKAFNSSENYFIHLGEKVYLSCSKDGSHQGTGIVSALTDSGFNIEVTGGEFYLSEKVDIFRGEEKKKEAQIGRGTVKRSKPVAVKGSGSILRMNVKNGDFVERGEALFETVEGILDGLYASDNTIVSPADGVVSGIQKKAGDTVSKGETMATVIPATGFQVEFEVQEADLFYLEEGQPVKLELYWDDDSAGQKYSGTITGISSISEEQKDGTSRKYFKAYAQFTPDAKIRIGMTMIVYPEDPEHAGETAETEAVAETEVASETEAAE